jgi:hypothetical protein
MGLEKDRLRGRVLGRVCFGGAWARGRGDSTLVLLSACAATILAEGLVTAHTCACSSRPCKTHMTVGSSRPSKLDVLAFTSCRRCHTSSANNVHAPQPALHEMTCRTGARPGSSRRRSSQTSAKSAELWLDA